MQELELEEVCFHCNGSGKADYCRNCNYCDGTGYVLTVLGERIMALIKKRLKLTI